MTDLGFKKLTVNNWLEPDKVSSSFVRISPVDGQAHPISAEEWVRDILKPSLIETVPTEIRGLFEVARGALAYGYFFYPLYTLGAQQLFRVAEAAVTHKCKALRAPRSINTFKKKVDYLTLGKSKIILEHEKEFWHAIRRLRNIASHSERQTILTSGLAIGMLEQIAEKIDSLFSSA